MKTVIENGAVALVPEVNGVAFTEIVAVFEADADFSPVGGYGGIVPQHVRFDTLSEYYLGREDARWLSAGTAVLLGCECGDLGCWPFLARITVSDATVAWSDFSQPHRAQRDYSGFGPFTFDRTQYDIAVAEAVASL